MQNKQYTNYIQFIANAHRRISLWKQIKIAYRLVRVTYRIVRSEKQHPSEKQEKTLKHLKAILKNLNLPPMNPYQDWVYRQLAVHTNGMKFHTKRYEMT